MDVSSLKQLLTKKYELSARERILVITAIGVIGYSVTVYTSTSKVAVPPITPKTNVQVSVNRSNIPVVPKKKESSAEAARDPFAKPPQANRQKDDEELASPSIHNDVPNMPPGVIPGKTPGSITRKDFKLTGIVSGADNELAVIRSGGKSKTYAVNDFIGTYRIAAINADDVILTNADDNVVLRLESFGQKEGKTSEK